MKTNKVKHRRGWGDVNPITKVVGTPKGSKGYARNKHKKLINSEILTSHLV